MTKVKLANITSNVLNPFLISALVVSLIAVEATDSWAEAAKWIAISLALCILPILAIVIILVKKGSVDSIFINVREERHRIYILSTVLLLVSVLTMYKLNAPPELTAVFMAGVASVIAFMLINLMWKISVHTAFIAASITMLIIVFGAAASLSAFLVPLTGWARIELKRHSPAQVVGGACLAAIIAFVVFYTSGLV